MGPKLTSTVPQHNLSVTRDPAVAGELHIVPMGRLQCDVLQVPVIVQPVLALLNFDQVDLAQLLIHSDVVGIDLGNRMGCQPLGPLCLTQKSEEYATQTGGSADSAS